MRAFEESPLLAAAFTIDPLRSMEDLGIDFTPEYRQILRESSLQAMYSSGRFASETEREAAYAKALRARTLPDGLRNITLRLEQEPSAEPHPPSPPPEFATQPTTRRERLHPSTGEHRAFAVSDELLSKGVRELYTFAAFLLAIIEASGGDNNANSWLRFTATHGNRTISIVVDPERMDEISISTEHPDPEAAALSVPVTVTVTSKEPAGSGTQRAWRVLRRTIDGYQARVHEASDVQLRQGVAFLEATSGGTLSGIMSSTQETVEVVSRVPATVVVFGSLVKTDQAVVVDMTRAAARVDHDGSLNAYDLELKRTADAMFRASDAPLELLKFDNGPAERLDAVSMYKTAPPAGQVGKRGIALAWAGFPVGAYFLGDLDAALSTGVNLLLKAIQSGDEYVDLVHDFIDSGGQLHVGNNTYLQTVPTPTDFYFDPAHGLVVEFSGHGMYKAWIFEIGFDYYFGVALYCENHTLKEKVVYAWVDIEAVWDFIMTLTGIIVGFLSFGLAGAVVGGVAGLIGPEIAEDIAGGKVESDIAGNSLFETLKVGPMQIQSRELCDVMRFATAIMAIVQGFRDD